MSTFRFKHFTIHQDHTALKVGTDAMLLGALCHFPTGSRLLDIGTGTGVLSLMCAQRFSPKEIIGIDISPDAITDAKTNFEQSPFPTPISAICTSLQDFENEQFDGIITNPPYFENSYKNSEHAKRLARHTDELSYTELAFHADRLLKPTGVLWLICPADSHTRMHEAFLKHDLFPQEIVRIFGKPEQETRTVIVYGRDEKTVQKKSLTVRDKQGKYTQAYIELTREFHDRKLD